MALAILIAASGPLFAQDSVDAITQKFESEKAAALVAYLEKNPEAKDRADGLSALLNSYLILEETEKIPPIIEEAYEASDKQDPQRIFQQMVAPMMQISKNGGNKDRAPAFFEKVRADFAKHPASKNVGEALDQMEGQLNQIGVGDTMEIAFTSTAGEEIDLAKMKGKVVLVDFWATWCGPCIAEMPNVIKAHSELNEKGFEVIGISLDQDKAALEKFIADNEMPWPQYFDGKGWQNEISGKFGISSIPATFLIGKDGKIIATNLRGAALEEAVTAELGK